MLGIVGKGNEPATIPLVPRTARDPRTTMRYDRARGPVTGHATYIAAAFIAAIGTQTPALENRAFWSQTRQRTACA